MPSSERRWALRRLYRPYGQEPGLAALRATGVRLAPGRGTVEPYVIFVGEAPGANEEKMGKPFCGPSGKVLDKLFKHIGLNRDKVWITNLVKYRPPDNRNPTLEERAASIPYLRREIEILGNRPVVALGRHSRNALNGALTGHLVGDWILNAGLGVPLLALHHPERALYQRSLMPEMEKQFERVLLADEILKEYRAVK